MKYLIDSHVLLWSLGAPGKLSIKSRELLIQSHIYVSTVSWWEISIKYSLGKLVLENGKPENLWKAALALNYRLLPVSGEEATSFYKLELLHKDPFDRMIVWQAIKNNSPLVSKDARLASYEKSGLQLIW
jgi:PIN domain nuclease of toxin-antitoxin system